MFPMVPVPTPGNLPPPPGKFGGDFPEGNFGVVCPAGNFGVVCPPGNFGVVCPPGNFGGALPAGFGGIFGCCLLSIGRSSRIWSNCVS